VRVIRLGTVVDQMLFDKDRLVIKAGRPVEIVFENPDLMPHNFVVTQPGALEEIGLLAESSATQPGAPRAELRAPLEEDPAGEPAAPARDSQRIAFTAPSNPGVYPYVCTYPGHWRRMFGALYVVEDLDEYLARSRGLPGQELAAVEDELLKFNRPRKEWKFDDLASAGRAAGARPLVQQRQADVQVANCVACHRLGGVGSEIGPDLTKLDPKLKPVDIVKEILDPSAKITRSTRPTSSRPIRARSSRLVLEDTPERIKLIENPLAKSEPVVLKPSQIVERTKSPNSIMPKGLLDKLTREEILDLVAYVATGVTQESALCEWPRARACDRAGPLIRIKRTVLRRSRSRRC